MLKKIKWVSLSVTVLAIIIMTYIIALVRYAEGEVTAINEYVTSLLTLPDVVSVSYAHRFNGLESYIVANIEHTSGQEVYFFVREGSVQHYFISSQLIDEMQANVIAQNVMPNGEIINTQLGILQETPIFEVQIEDDGVVHYIVINAQTSEIWLNFYLSLTTQPRGAIYA